MGTDAASSDDIFMLVHRAATPRVELRGALGTGLVRVWGSDAYVGACIAGIAATGHLLPHVGLSAAMRQSMFGVNGALVMLTPITLGVRVD